MPTSLPIADAVRVPIIGIVGGIGSGKSTLARWVAAHHPAVVIDADAIGHELLASPPVQVALRSTFGDDIFAADGTVIRSALARRVFGATPEQQVARRYLDDLLHPLIREEIARRAAAVDPNRMQVILLDAALLLEAGLREQCRAVVFVDTPLEKRAAWVATNRGWTADELRHREASQWSLEAKRAACHLAIANTGEIAAAGKALWEGIQQFL